MKNNKKYQNLTCCPICNKQYDVYWKIINHIRKCKDIKHQNFIKRNDEELVSAYLLHTNNRKTLNDTLFSIFPKNILCGISYEKLMRCISNYLSVEEIEIIGRRNRKKTQRKNFFYNEKNS